MRFMKLSVVAVICDQNVAQQQADALSLGGELQLLLFVALSVVQTASVRARIQALAPALAQNHFARSGVEWKECHIVPILTLQRDRKEHCRAVLIV